MEPLGQRLRKAREAKGWTADDVAARLKIHVKYFHAIESGDTASLPGSFFYRSFVRQYAAAVGLPEDAYADELNSAAQSHLAEVVKGPTDSLPALEYEVPPMPTFGGDSREETKRWVWRVVLLLIVVAISSAGYMLWVRWRSFDEARRAAAQQAAPVQEQTTPPPALQTQAAPPAQPEAAPPQPPDSGLASAQPDAAAQAQTSQPPSTQTAPPSSLPSSTAPPPATVAPPATVPSPATAPQAGAISVTLTAREDVWVDVWADGRRVHSNIIRAGQSKNFGGGEMLRVRYGNAGGMEVQWNGRGVESPGPRGQIRTWEYLPGSYRMVPVAPKNPPQ